MEWLSIPQGIRPCCVTTAGPEDWTAWVSQWSHHGLGALPMGLEIVPGDHDVGAAGWKTGSEHPGAVRLLVGSPRNIALLKTSMELSDDAEIARLLGFPPCCYQFYRELWIDQGREDPTWPMAVASVAAPADAGTIDVDGPPHANILWRWLGIRAVPHLPCRFDCQRTIELGEQFIALGRNAGLDKEMDWLLEILSWPVQFSTRAGVGEIKTPILTLSVPTDPAPGEQVVRRRGTSYPAEGVRGTVFPYVAPGRVQPSRLARVEEIILEELMKLPEGSMRGAKIADLCTGDYFTTVELTDGRQGAAINLFNVHGPHRVPYNHRHYDSLLLRLVDADPFLLDTFLTRTDLDPLGQSVKIAVLNALSAQLLSPDRLLPHDLHRTDGRLPIKTLLREGDTVGMIGCLGNYACDEVGQCRFLKKVYFSDFEYVAGYKQGVEEEVQKAFDEPEKVELSGGSENRFICQSSDVLIITSGTLCTNTLDELLGCSQDPREVIVVGRDYAMDPLPLFERGVTGLTTQMIVLPHIVRFVREKLSKKGPGFTDSLKQFFKQVSIRKEMSFPAPSRRSVGYRFAGAQKEAASASWGRGAVQAPSGATTILKETLQHLEADPLATARRITGISLGNYFTVIELDDGSIGACNSYYRIPLPVLSTVEAEIQKRLIDDPLLVGWLFKRSEFTLPLAEHELALLQGALQATLVNAVSARSIRNGGDQIFEALQTLPFDPFAGARTALVIGFGGYLDELAQTPHVTHLHIADLAYAQRRQKMEAVVADYRRAQPEKTITLSDGHDTAQRLRAVDVVSITGSALCNGTMDSLIQEAQGGPRIIIQGQSAAIHPRAFFARGADLVATTLKPRDLLKIARAQGSAKKLRRLLEGGLPWIYLLPRKTDP
jgi:uncharacterized protein (DUF4213/DUF364 family)